MFELFALLAKTDIELTILGEKETQRGKGFDVSLYHRESTSYCRAVILYDDFERFLPVGIVSRYFKPMILSIERNKNMTQEEFDALVAEGQS